MCVIILLTFTTYIIAYVFVKFPICCEQPVIRKLYCRCYKNVSSVLFHTKPHFINFRTHNNNINTDKT